MTVHVPEDIDTDRLNADGRRGAILLCKQDRYAKRIRNGLCANSASHGPAEQDHTMCIGCLVDKRHDQNERNARKATRRKIIACKICGRAGHNARGCAQPRPAAFDPARVKNDRTSRYRQTLRASGICVNSSKHGPPVAGYTKCAACRALGKAKS